MTNWWLYDRWGNRWVIVNAWAAAINVGCLACVALSDTEPEWRPT
jgi:hypothetical protein